MKAKGNQSTRLGVTLLSVILATLVIKCEGNAEDAKRDSNKGNSPQRETLAAAAEKADSIEYESLMSEYREVLKHSAENSYDVFCCERKLAQYYIEHKQFDRAQTMLIKLVAFARDSKNYFDEGAEWDERRRKGEPTEGTEKMNINGKEVTVFSIDNRRPSAKFNRADLVRYLYVLSSIDKRLGQPNVAGDELTEAKNNYSKYQFEKPAWLLTSFDTFIAKYSHGNILGTPPLKALMDMDYE